MTQFNFTSTKEIESNGINIVVYGKSGSGKTSLAKTKDKLLIIDFEDGLLCLKGTNIPVYKPKSLDDFVSFINYCKANTQLEFDTLLIDSMTSFAEYIVAEKKKSINDPRQAYMFMQDNMYDLIKFLVGIKHLNIVFICQESRMEDQLEGSIIRGPSFPGRNVGLKIPYLVDCVLHLKTSLTKNQQGELVKSVYFVTSATATEEGKDRTGKLDLYELPDLTHIFNKIRAE